MRLSLSCRSAHGCINAFSGAVFYQSTLGCRQEGALAAMLVGLAEDFLGPALRFALPLTSDVRTLRALVVRGALRVAARLYGTCVEVALFPQAFASDSFALATGQVSHG